MEVFQDQIVTCIEEYNLLLEQNNYISKKDYDSFVDKFQGVFSNIKNYSDKNSTEYIHLVGIAQNGYKLLEEKNKKYVDKALTQYKSYFDNLFKGVDENIILDEEQRKAIVVDEDYSLIVAGAGSGKTTTIVAKVKFLIDKKNIKPDEIILLAFNNKVADELNDILNNKFKLGVDVLTFHKLGMKFVRGIFYNPVKVIDNNLIMKILGDYFKFAVFKDKRLLEKHIQNFDEYLGAIASDNKWMNFDNYDDYYKYYTNKMYQLVKNEDLSGENAKKIKNRSRYYKTINGEFVKSKGEVEIANFLYLNNISYTYEKVYPYHVGNLQSYSPDFTIHLKDKDIYLEYFGLASINKYGYIFSESIDYKKEIYLKRDSHKENNTDLIELYGGYDGIRNLYLEKLEIELRKRNINFIPKSDDEIFFRLMETSKDSLYWRLISLFKEFIFTFKELDCTENKFDELIAKADDIKSKSKFVILKRVFNYYNDKIHNDFLIDFPDMINYGCRYMEYVKNNLKNKCKYVFVDEYQDISLARYNLLKKLSVIFNSKIVAVGDDWQSIYSFSGSDIQLFTNFFELMGYGELVKITKTYRNSQELIDVAGEFVSKNKKLIMKNLISDKHLKSPIQLVNYDYDPATDASIKKSYARVTNELIKYLYKRNPNHKILLLGRFNSDVEPLIDSRKFYFKNKDNGTLVCKDCPHANVTFLTVHSSKGLGSDQVILLNALNINKGFPSKIKDDPVIIKLKQSVMDEEEITNDSIDYLEERRLFYVAMTRTKEFLFILVPIRENFKSDFIKEISSNKNVTEFSEIT